MNCHGWQTFIHSTRYVVVLESRPESLVETKAEIHSFACLLQNSLTSDAKCQAPWYWPLFLSLLTPILTNGWRTFQFRSVVSLFQSLIHIDSIMSSLEVTRRALGTQFWISWPTRCCLSLYASDFRVCECSLCSVRPC
jgi:hypothetical protein